MESSDGDGDADSLTSRKTVVASPLQRKTTSKNTEDELETQLKQTLCEIEQVDSLLQDLNDRKRKLIKKYDRLKEEKMQIKSKALATENWHEGKICLYIFRKSLISVFGLLQNRSRGRWKSGKFLRTHLSFRIIDHNKLKRSTQFSQSTMFFYCLQLVAANHFATNCPPCTVWV